MIDKIKAKIIQFVVNKYALGYLVKAYKFLKGYKTQLGIAAAVVVFALKINGVIDEALYTQVMSAIGAWTGVSLLDKIARYKDAIEGVVGEVKSNQSQLK